MSDEASEEKSFSDEELADIMNEIETLEEGFVEEQAAAPAGDLSNDDKDLAPAIADSQAQEVSFEEKELPIESVIEETQKEPQSDALEKEGPGQAGALEKESAPTLENGEGLDDKKVETLQVVENIHMEQSVMKDNVPKEKTQLDFMVSGEMEMKLNFHVAGQTIKFVLDGTTGFEIEMDGGAKFSIPLGTSLKKAS